MSDKPDVVEKVGCAAVVGSILLLITLLVHSVITGGRPRPNDWFVTENDGWGRVVKIVYDQRWDGTTQKVIVEGDKVGRVDLWSDRYNVGDRVRLKAIHPRMDKPQAYYEVDE